MAHIQAKALYDFDGDPAGNELTIYNGDILTIVRQDIGDGWWEAQNSQGKNGLVPEAYLEIISMPEPSIPPPPPPPTYNIPPPPSVTSSWQQPAANNVQDNQWQQENTDSWPAPPAPTAPPQESTWDQPYSASQTSSDWNQPSQTSQSYSAGNMQREGSYEDWDDDWDDDDESVTSEQLPGQGNFGLSQANRDKTSVSHEGHKIGTVRKTFNRYSQFSKQGGDAFLFGTTNLKVAESERMAEIIDSQNGPIWKPVDMPYTCLVASPKKESKLKGLKSFIAYQLTPSFSNIQVSRRYKHFDWLHERLLEKFNTIAVHPLPDKQISGRYEDDFITERMRQLQLWMDRMALHPIISHSEVFNHFLTCTDEKKWKMGKRKAEKDELMGGKFFLAVRTPETPLDRKDTENKIEHFGKFEKVMDDGVKHLSAILESQAKRYQGPFKKEYQKLGNSFINLSTSFGMDKRPEAENITKAMHHTGRTYEAIGSLYEEQPRNDLHPMIEGLWEYKGILSTVPDIVQVHKAAMSKVNECQRLTEESKMTDADAMAVASRADTISYAVLAEMNHFQEHRVRDFNIRMKLYLQAQIEFYRKITGKLEETLGMYE